MTWQLGTELNSPLEKKIRNVQQSLQSWTVRSTGKLWTHTHSWMLNENDLCAHRHACNFFIYFFSKPGCGIPFAIKTTTFSAFFFFLLLHPFSPFCFHLSCLFSMFEVLSFPAVVRAASASNNPPLLHSHTLSCDQCKHGPEVQHTGQSREASEGKRLVHQPGSSELHQHRTCGTFVKTIPGYFIYMSF